jgi:CRP/FNR family transcriptional regulator
VDKVQALKKTALFGKLDAVALKSLATCAIEKRLQKNENLFLAGQKAEGLFVIVKGAIRAYRSNADGREQTIHLERGGAAIAELPLYDDLPYPSSAAADEPTDLLFIAKDDVRRFLMTHPIIALEALKILAGRLRKTAGLVEMLALKEVDQRLAAFLFQEAMTRGIEKPSGHEITVPPYPQIASRLGSVREVVSRAMTKLTKEGLVKNLGGRKFSIPNPAKLKGRAETHPKSMS